MKSGNGTLLERMMMLYLSYALNCVQAFLENQDVLRPFIKKKLREQIIDILGDNLSEENVEKFCISKGINPKIAETVFLYLGNSKDDVADILGIQGTTVIRRIKVFIEKATN